jgi:glutathione S-transferase
MNLGTELVILATILSLLVYLWTSLKVGSARAQHNVKAPAISGSADFERVFRVQQNTMEQIVLFLPSLWLFHMLFAGIWAGLIGLVWPIGRVIYALAYYRDAEKRGFGMWLTFLPAIILLLWSLAGLVLVYMRGI